MAVRPVASIPCVTSSAVEDDENPDGPFLLNSHILCFSLFTITDGNPSHSFYVFKWMMLKTRVDILGYTNLNRAIYYGNSCCVHSAPSTAVVVRLCQAVKLFFIRSTPKRASLVGTIILFHLSCYHLTSSGSHLASPRLRTVALTQSHLAFALGLLL